MGETVIVSAPATDPFTVTVSESASPRISSAPSPAFQTNESLPAPMPTSSLPRLPSIVSFSVPPRSTSAREPPTTTSLPPWPLSVVASVFVNTPLLSLIRSRSPPPPAFTTILVNAERRNVKSAEPLSPTSTTSRPGAPTRSVIFSAAFPPLTVSVPFLTLASTAAPASGATPRTATTTAQTNRSRAAVVKRGWGPCTGVAVRSIIRPSHESVRAWSSVGRGGIEPPTPRFSAACSTD